MIGGPKHSLSPKQIFWVRGILPAFEKSSFFIHIEWQLVWCLEPSIFSDGIAPRQIVCSSEYNEFLEGLYIFKLVAYWKELNCGFVTQWQAEGYHVLLLLKEFAWDNNEYFIKAKRKSCWLPVATFISFWSFRGVDARTLQSVWHCSRYSCIQRQGLCVH